MEKDLIALFREYIDKQEVLSKLSEHEELRIYNNSELHIIAAIGDLDNPNVTAIAKQMGMTKGGISKNIKKLMQAKLIEAYQAENNNRKVFYRLTDAGKNLYDKHSIAHQNWIERDNAFFSGYSAKELEQFQRFMSAYIKHLDEEIAKRS